MRVQTGAECEPLLLNILRPGGVELDSVGMADVESVGEASVADASGLVQVMRGFSGGVTLGGVREALSLQEALVCQLTKGVGPGGEGGGASRWKVCSPEAMRRTLKELTLRDGDTLLLLPHTHLNNRSVCRANLILNLSYSESDSKNMSPCLNLFIYLF